MDYSGFRRSGNVEDERTDLIGELINRLVTPLTSAAKDVYNHPFERTDQLKSMEYLAQPLDRAAHSPLAVSAGANDVKPYGAAPIAWGPLAGEVKTPEEISFWNTLLKGSL